MLAEDTAVLSPSTSKAAHNKVMWTGEMNAAFSAICKSVCNICERCISLQQDKYSIATDASGKGIGGVLQIWRGRNWQAAAFFSRHLRGPEHRYSAMELEALALVKCVSYFNYYLYGRTFVAYSDHKPPFAHYSVLIIST